MPTKTKEDVIEMLETVIDPELGIDIWTMGLVYKINIISDEHVEIVMTYTTPFCPLGPQIQADINRALKTIDFKYIEIEVTFDPPWKPSAELRGMLGV